MTSPAPLLAPRRALAVLAMSGVGSDARAVPLAGAASQPAGCLFPFSYASCCPCLPTSLTKVQDWLHLTLLFGVLGSLLCLVEMIYELAWGGPCRSPFCFKQIISGVVVLPSTVYFLQTIGHYDEQLKEKKRRHQEEVENLIDNINMQVTEMNELCKKVTENANEFAMGRFNDKMEYFKKFLKGVKVHYRELYAGDDMLEELRKFILHWLQNFSGSLLNRDSSPLLRGAAAELEAQLTPEAVIEVALRRLGESKVLFSFQMPAASPYLPQRLRMSLTASVASAASASIASSADVEDGSVFQSTHMQPEGKCGISWLRLVACKRCGCERSTSADGMPLTLFLGFIELRILSRVHANLLVSFLVDIPLIFFEMCTGRWTSFGLVALNEVCVSSMLACFEQINEIAQLERQIHVYERRSEEVAERRDEARRNWEQVQQLHDLWLYRTLPCLSIMGQIHSHLVDEDMAVKEAQADNRAHADPRPEFLRHANQSLLCLEQKLGPLNDWCKDGPISDEWKQSVGRQLKDCEKTGDVHELIQMLPIITSDLRMLDALPPSAHASFCSSSASSTPRREASPEPAPSGARGSQR